MKFGILLTITFCIMVFSFLFILLLENFGIFVPLLFFIYIIFIESTIIFVLTVIVVKHGRSLGL